MKIKANQCADCGNVMHDLRPNHYPNAEQEILNSIHIFYSGLWLVAVKIIVFESGQ